MFWLLIFSTISFTPKGIGLEYKAPSVNIGLRVFTGGGMEMS